jgi:hypothetical protein
LKLKCDILVSSLCFLKCNLYRYTTDIFTTVATTGEASSGILKYNGATAVGDKVYFTPMYQHNVGIFDTATNVFATVPTVVGRRRLNQVDP